MSKFLSFVIRLGFYALFFLVPLAFWPKSHELFEYNKMMLTYGLTIIIAGAWLSKMILEKKLIFKRSFMDLPILLYLSSHIVSTIFSIDFHTSVWGYYTRFHEGLLSTFSYIVLFYAFISNIEKKDLGKMFSFGFASASIVSIWGTLEHFGVSPSCVFITGNANVDCWIQDVKNRVFATLGQPNWMAAYLDIVILMGIGIIFHITGNVSRITDNKAPSSVIRNTLYVILVALFFAALLFTKSRSGILGLFAGGSVFILGTYQSSLRGTKQSVLNIFKNKALLTLLILLSLLVLFFGLPFDKFDKWTIPNLLNPPKQVQTVAKPKSSDGYIDIGISESGDIRKIVWKGAIDVWKRYPIFGSGVETFAFAYYKDRPVEHNMVSEWDFLYNKAHNEFLNLLATTGTIGILTYLSLIVTFAWWVYKQIITSRSPLTASPLVLALFAAYVSILVTNFFGFSVVIVGIYFFLIPAFSQILLDDNRHSGESTLGDDSRISKGTTKRDLEQARMTDNISGVQWVLSGVAICVVLYLEWSLFNMWDADQTFAYGKNLDSVNMFQQATPYLSSAVEKSPDEPLYRDEYSYNLATLATGFFQQSTESAEIKQQTVKAVVSQAINNSNIAVSSQPNNLSFWKTRVKVFYSLATIDPNYITEALNAIATSTNLAPTDPKVRYNYGLILGKIGQTKEAIKEFEETVRLKTDYSDARYALGLYYEQEGQKDKAREQMEFIVNRIGKDERAVKWLEENK